MCGIVGVYDVNGKHENDDLVSKCFSLLRDNENRGQDSYGMSIIFDDGEVILERDSGLHGLNNKIGKYRSRTSKKIRAVLGQARYTTSGVNNKESAQPRIFTVCGITYVLEFNGNISNVEELALKYNFIERYNLKLPILDTQVVECLIIDFVENNNGNCSLEDIIAHVNNEMKGAFNVALASSDKDMAISVDKNGVRGLPYSYSPDKGLFVFSSEQAPIDDVSKRIKLAQEILVGGEITGINFSDQGIPKFSKVMMDVKDEIRNIRCLIDFLYLMRADSQEAFKLRRLVGEALYEENPEEFNLETSLCIPVPNSGYYSADGYAQAAGMNFNSDILKKHSKKRTFIIEIDGREEEVLSSYYIDMDVLREFALENPDLERVILIDDSVINGTTMGHIPSMLKEAFKEVYGRDIDVHIRVPMGVSAAGCESGIVMNRAKLVTVQNCENPYYPTDQELQKIATKIFYAESLKYLSTQKLKQVAGDYLNKKLCMACIDGFDLINYEKTLVDGTRVLLTEKEIREEKIAA